MSAVYEIDPLDDAELAADVEFVPLAHDLRAVLVVGAAAKAAARRRIARRQVEREAEAKRVKRTKLARSNERHRGTQPGGAA